MNRQPEEFSVRVIPYEVPYRDDTVSCWLYLTDGLERRGHAELLFCLRGLLREVCAGQLASSSKRERAGKA